MADNWEKEDVAALKKHFASIIKNLQNIDHIAVVTIDNTGFLNTVNASADDASGHALIGGLESLKFKMLNEFYNDDEVIELNVDDEE